MHPMLQKNVDSGFITEEQGNYIETAIENGESIIVSGHRSSGIRVMMATCMAIVKSKYDTAQVKDETSYEKEARYYLIPGLDGDFEAIVQAGFEKEGSSIVSVKEPEHPYSIMKIMKNAYKKTGDASKVVTLLECRKIDGVPFMINLNRHFYDEAGKVKKEETPRIFE